MENLPTTLSNLPTLVPIYLSFQKSDYLTCVCISFVFVFSFLSHLVENHKHGMNGFIKVSRESSYYLNRLDVLGCIMVIVRFSSLYFNKNLSFSWDDYFILVVSLLINFISELDKYNHKLKWNHYIPLHSIWHLLAARMMYIFLLRAYVTY